MQQILCQIMKTKHCKEINFFTVFCLYYNYIILLQMMLMHLIFKLKIIYFILRVMNQINIYKIILYDKISLTASILLITFSLSATLPVRASKNPLSLNNLLYFLILFLPI